MYLTARLATTQVRSFTGSFIGQTANNSMVFANLNSGVPEIAVTDAIAPADDLQVSFGDVTELTSATQTVTVTNSGGGSLILGNIAQADPLAAPFAITNDTVGQPYSWRRLHVE